MAFPVALLPWLIGGGIVVAIVVGGKAEAKFALSDDCETNLLAALNPEQMHKWIMDNLSPALDRARAGRGVVVSEGLEGHALPQFILDEVAGCQAELQNQGLTLDAARALCRIDGKKVYMTADPNDPADVAMYLYQQVSRPACRVLKVASWSQGLPGSVPDNMTIQWPSDAAECLFRSLRVVVKMHLFSQTGLDRYIVTASDLAAVAAVCPQGGWAPQSSDPYGPDDIPEPPPAPDFPDEPVGSTPYFDPIPGSTNVPYFDATTNEPSFDPTPEPTIPAPGPGFGQPTLPGVSLGGTLRRRRLKEAGLSLSGRTVGHDPAYGDGINYDRMASDANSGALHPAHVLTCIVFQ